MGILDIFKKKKTDITFPENELERCLIKAASDSSSRKEFYTKLLWSELIVLTAGQTSLEQGKIILEKDTEVQLIRLQNGYLPVFTSTNRIFDKGIIKEQVPFMSMKGQHLFDMVKDSPIILNPYSDYGKEFLPEEIEGILNGTIFDRLTPIIIEKDTQIQIGQPQIYPSKLTNALAELFKTLPKVNAAYIAMTRMDSADIHPHFLVGIDIIDGNLTEISKYAGPVSERYLGQTEIVDFILIENNDGHISAYLKNETTPFYIKK
jgi:hypothetical protein